MQVPQGIWIWTEPATGAAPAEPVVLAGVPDVASVHAWAAAHGVGAVAWRDHPAVPALGATRFPAVWLGTLPEGPWAAWTRDGRWARPTTWPTFSAAAAALRAAGQPWRFWTPASLWAQRTAPDAPADPHRPWLLGQAPTGGVFAWQAGPRPTFLRGTDGAVFLWPQAAGAIAFFAAHQRPVRGFCPRTIAQRLTRTRAVSRRAL